MTVSTDGSVLWWDLRKLSESLESMPLREKGSETTLGGVVLEYDTNAGPTNFMVGTEQVRHTCTHMGRLGAFCGSCVGAVLQHKHVSGPCQGRTVGAQQRLHVLAHVKAGLSQIVCDAWLCMVCAGLHLLLQPQGQEPCGQSQVRAQRPPRAHLRPAPQPLQHQVLPVHRGLDGTRVDGRHGCQDAHPDHQVPRHLPHGR